jgi:hypothetical protein
VVLFDLQTAAIQQVLRGNEDAVHAGSALDALPLIATGAMTTDRRGESWSPDLDPFAAAAVARKKEFPGESSATKDGKHVVP